MSKTKTFELNFDLLPTLKLGSMFAVLPAEVDSKLCAYKATYDRAMGALTFSALLCNVPIKVDESGTKLREAYLRAALGEFVSMEETIQLDDSNGMHPKIRDSQNPLLHMMKQLRNMQFHLSNSALTSHQQNVEWGSQNSAMDLWYVEEIDLTDFNKLHGAANFSDSDKSKMIGWFNSNQKLWGINELILQSVTLYAKELLAKKND
ncbi:MAG: hypothetical protein JWM11_7580 [Planctomycetaceae bacterium]|nr:hypothetical protein [Planctomycetaceae bacterium]